MPPSLANTINRQSADAATIATLLSNALSLLDSDQASARLCILRANSLVHGEPELGGPHRGGLAPWQARRVEAYVKTGLASRLRVDDAAAVARLSASYFSRAFKVTFGVSFMQYVSRQRVERAKLMMLMTAAPLCQIALDCGLADQAHFTRLFRRHVGAPPSAWRRRMRDFESTRPLL